MLDLALHSDKGPVRLGTVAQRQGIGVKYLEQIARSLTKANLLKSFRGPKGGRRLARAPQDINLAEVVMLLEGGLQLTDCVAQTGTCEQSGQCVARILWTEISQAVIEKLQAMSLKDLMDRAQALRGPEECKNSDGKA